MSVPKDFSGVQRAMIQADIDEIRQVHPLVNYGSDSSPLWLANVIAAYLKYTSIRHAVARLRAMGHAHTVRVKTKTRGYQNMTCIDRNGVQLMLKNKKITGVALEVYNVLFGIDTHLQI
jgi:hypothetical protein